MHTFKIVDGDICFDENKAIALTDGQPEEQQALTLLLTTGMNEWFLNAAHGLAYEKIRGKNITDEDIMFAVMAAVQQEKRVKSIDEILITRDRPKRSVDIKIHCTMKSGNEVKVEVSNFG